jgi:IS5 family transposase
VCAWSRSLQAISDFIDDHEAIVEQVRRDLARGLRKPASGRRGLTPQQVLRSFVLKRVKNWDYRELRERIADGMTLRQFTDFHCWPVPRHQAFRRDFNRLTPDTLKAINDLVVQAAVGLGLEDGSKLSTAVVESDIHHPTDNTLLWDEYTIQARSTLSRRHRGAHLRAVPRSRHEALPCRGDRALCADLRH